MQNKKDIFISTTSQVGVRLVTLVFALISVKLLTNYLGTVGTGEYNTITTYINFWIVIADLGLFSAAVREISKNPEKEKKILANVLSIRAISALIASVLATILVLFTHYSDTIKLGTLLAAGFIFFNLLASVYDIVLQYRIKMQYSAISELISKFVALTALFFIIQHRGSFIAIAATITLSGFCIWLLKWWFSSFFLRFSAKFDRQLIIWITHISLPLGIVFIVNNIFFKVDTLILFVIKGPAAVGIYSVAYKVLEVTIFVGSYFASSLKPALSQNIEQDKTAAANLVSKAFIIMLFISLPIALLSAIFSKEIIIFLSNKNFISGSFALILLGFTLPFIYFDTLLGEILIAKDARTLLIRIAICMLIFNFCLNLLIIPIFSFNGAAAVTLLSEFLLCMINLYYTRKIIPYQIDFSIIFKIGVVGLLTLFIGLFLRSLPIQFLIPLILTFLSYLGLSFVLQVIKPAQIRTFLK